MKLLQENEALLGKEADNTFRIVGGVCTLIACVISFHLMFKHWKHYSKPEHQRNITRILWMVPIYSLESWLSLFFYKEHLLLNIFRDCYEAYVIYVFMSLLTSYLGGYERLNQVLDSKRPIKHPFPFCCIVQPIGKDFLRRCRQGVLQFVVLKPLTSTLALFTHTLHPQYYQEGNYSHWNIWLYVLILDNISISTSLYCLYLFFLATKDELKEHNPGAKFLAVKCIVFFSFWQGMIINLLVHFGLITDEKHSTSNVATEIQDFLICIEMVGIAVLHKRIFPYTQHSKIIKSSDCRGIFSNCMDSTKVHDITDDIMDSFLSQKG